MPGLRLTLAQAQRLWALDRALCDAVLAALVEARFLVQSRNASFIRADEGRFYSRSTNSSTMSTTTVISRNSPRAIAVCSTVKR